MRRQTTKISEAINSIAANLRLNYHDYSCGLLQETSQCCTCDRYDDIEIVNNILKTYGYELIDINEPRNTDR